MASHDPWGRKHMQYEIQLTQRDEMPTAVVVQVVPVPQISTFLGEAFGEVMAAITAAGHFPAGAPFARYDFVEVPKGVTPETFRVEAGFPVNDPIEASGRVQPGVLPGGPAAVTIHEGSYQEVSAAYEAIEAWIASEGMVPSGPPWESYLDDPGEVPVPHTEVVWPCEKV